MRKYIAELIGTFVLVTFGCGTAVGLNTLVTKMGVDIPLGLTTLAIALAFGLCIVAMAYSIGNVSGCHVNPAVSLGVLLAGKMSGKDFVGYIIFQCIGGIAGAAVLWGIFGSNEALGTNGYGQYSALNASAVTAVIVEIILTFVFVLVILGVTSKKQFAATAGIVIGLSLTLIHLLGIPFTGTSVNPARSLGPALLSGGDALAQLPVFIIAPLIGGALAALVYRGLLHPEADQ